jgi:hypothetical protein
MKKKPIIFNYQGKIVITQVEFPEICPQCGEKAVGHGLGYEFDVESNILEVLIECPACENYYHTFNSYNATMGTCEILNTKILNGKKKDK